MNLKNDIVFKMFFSKKGNERFLISFLEAVLKTKIESIEILQEASLQEITKDGKSGRIDLKATIDNKQIVNIELQVKDKYNMKKRTAYYGSRLMSEQLKKGEFYNDVKPVILINILNYNMLDVSEYHTKTVTVAEKHREYEVINEITYHFIELPKFRKSKPELANELECWLALIDWNDRGLIEMAEKKSKIIQDAKEEVKEILSDAKIREINYYHEKWERDEADAKAYALDKQKMQIAKKLLKLNVDINTIMEATGLSKEEIDQIKL